MTTVDNFDLIESIMDFKNSNEFYFLQIIQRKKDGCDTQIGNNGYRTIKVYYIFSKEQFLKKKDKIKELRKSTGMNRKEFCKYFEIPYRTVTEWERGTRKMPDYVLRLLAYKVKMDDLIVKEDVNEE